MIVRRTGAPPDRGRGERQLDPENLGDHVDRLFRAAWGLCGSREDAEDLVQETFARVLARPRFLHRDEDVGYLLGALRKTFLSAKRTERRRPRTKVLPEDREPPEPRTADDPVTALEASEVFAAVAALPDDYRDVIVAVDVAGLGYEEAAAALDIPSGTVMSRLFRARGQVVRRLEGS